MKLSFSKLITLLLIVLFVYFVTAAYHSFSTPTVSKPSVEGVKTESEPTNTTKATVVKVVDGDTLSVSINGEKHTIRIIGIDTPETVDPRKPIQCFGVAASNRAKELLSSQTINLETDPTQGTTDKYGRLLRFVWLNGQDYGLETIRQGYAHEYTYDVPYKYQTEYKKAQKDAMTAKRGLWADNVCNEATPTPISNSSQPAEQSNLEGGTRTDTKNCSDFTTHADAQNYFLANGGSAEHDIDGLDPDHDGNACESLP